MKNHHSEHKNLMSIDIDAEPRTKFEDLIFFFTAWSTNIGFPEATAMSSLLKCEDELFELKSELLLGGEKALDEYVDCLMCLFDSARRQGYSTKQIVEAFKLKLHVNINRKWKKNENNTYSHE